MGDSVNITSQRATLRARLMGIVLFRGASSFVIRLIQASSVSLIVPSTSKHRPFMRWRSNGMD